jgi:hypothetical protein
VAYKTAIGQARCLALTALLVRAMGKECKGQLGADLKKHSSVQTLVSDTLKAMEITLDEVGVKRAVAEAEAIDINALDASMFASWPEKLVDARPPLRDAAQATRDASDAEALHKLTALPRPTNRR